MRYFKIFLLAGILLAGCGGSSLDKSPTSGTEGVVAKAPLNASVGPVTVSLSSGWNPVGFQAASLTSLNADSAVPMASYDGGYRVGSLTLSDVNSGEGTRRGFWVYAPAATTFTYSGSDAAGATINLKSGWNLIAFPGTGNIAGTSLTCRRNGQSVPLANYVLAQFYELGPGTNTPIDVTTGGICRPGKAYWVFALDTVSLSYGSPSASPTPASSPSPSPSASPSGQVSGAYNLVGISEVLVSPSYNVSGGSFSATHRDGQVELAVSFTGPPSESTRTRFTWSAPPAVLRPGNPYGDVIPMTYSHTLLSVNSASGSSGGGSTGLNYVTAAGSYNLDSLPGLFGPAGTTVTRTNTKPFQSAGGYAGLTLYVSNYIHGVANPGNSDGVRYAYQYVWVP